MASPDDSLLVHIGIEGLPLTKSPVAAAADLSSACSPAYEPTTDVTGVLGRLLPFQGRIMGARPL